MLIRKLCTETKMLLYIAILLVTGDGERGTGSGEWGTLNREPGTGVWERAFSEKLSEN